MRLKAPVYFAPRVAMTTGLSTLTIGVPPLNVTKPLSARLLPETPLKMRVLLGLVTDTGL